MGFTKATKKKAKLRFAIIGPAGAGKTYSALSIAIAMGERVALIDTEHGSASKYADKFEFDTLQLTSFAPERYIEAIKAAEDAGYDVLVIDSLSHAWAGKDGILEFVDRQKENGNGFAAWGKATPKQNALTEAILGCKIHVIATVRSKIEHVQEKDEKTGKTVVRKIGLQPVQRDSLEYEFDVIGDISISNVMTISKTRCPDLFERVFRKPGKEVADILLAWLTAGVDAPAPKLTDGLASGLRITDEEVATLREWLDATGTDEQAFLAAFGKRGTGLEGPVVDALESLNPAQYEAGLCLLKKKSEKRATA